MWLSHVAEGNGALGGSGSLSSLPLSTTRRKAGPSLSSQGGASGQPGACAGYPFGTPEPHFGTCGTRSLAPKPEMGEVVGIERSLALVVGPGFVLGMDRRVDGHSYRMGFAGS